MADDEVPTIASITIYDTQGNCNAANIQGLMEALRSQQVVDQVTCQRTIWILWYSKESDISENEVTVGNSKAMVVQFFWPLVILVPLFLALLYRWARAQLMEQGGTSPVPVCETSPLLRLQNPPIDDGTCCSSDSSSIADWPFNHCP